MNAAGTHLLGLINSVLNYAKIEAGAVQYDFDAVNVDEVLRAAETLVAPQARAKGLTLTLAACDHALHVRADGEKLRQIALNLIRRRPSGKDSLTVKRKKAGWSIAYLIETIAAVPA